MACRSIVPWYVAINCRTRSSDAYCYSLAGGVKIIGAWFNHREISGRAIGY